jgi:hypothetical protein
MAALMLGVLDVAVVVDVVENDDGVRAVLELEGPPACPSCGSTPVTEGVVEVERRGSPLFGRPLLMIWRLRSWRCDRPGCGRSWAEEVPLSGREAGQ